MASQVSLRHPALELLAFLLVPIAINLLTLANLPRIYPSEPVFLVPLSGAILAFAWGHTGLLICVLLGVALGLPVAGMQAAYLRGRLARAHRGEELHQALQVNPWLGGAGPWLVVVVMGFLIGGAWVFPPVGGPLVAVNVLWARTLVYHPLWVMHQYLRVDAELRAEEQAEEAPGLREARHSA